MEEKQVSMRDWGKKYVAFRKQEKALNEKRNKDAIRRDLEAFEATTQSKMASMRRSRVLTTPKTIDRPQRN